MAFYCSPFLRASAREGVMFVLLLLLTGCQHSIEFVHKTPGFESFAPFARNPKPVALLGYVKSVKVISDGIESAPSEDLLYRFRNKMLDSKIFADVVFSRPFELFVELNLTVNITNEQDKVANTSKVVLSGLSLFLLAPALPLVFEYSSDCQLTVVNIEGQPKSYSSSAKAILTSSGSPDGLRQERTELYQVVTNGTFNSLMSQIIQDADFVLTVPRTRKLPPES